MEKRNNEKGISVIGLIVVIVFIGCFIYISVNFVIALNGGTGTNKVVEKVLNSKEISNQIDETKSETEKLLEQAKTVKETNKRMDAKLKVSYAVGESQDRAYREVGYKYDVEIDYSIVYSSMLNELKKIGAEGVPDPITESSFPLIIEVDGYSIKIAGKDEKFKISDND